MATQKTSKGKGLYLHAISIRWRRRILVEVLRVEEKRRGRMSLTQYLESQEDQDMTRLLNFTRTQERGRERVFFCVLWNEGEGGLYSSGGENMNGMPFNEG